MASRNWLAVAALWTLGATWLGLVGTTVYAILEENDPPNSVGWTLLGVGTFGFLLALAASPRSAPAAKRRLRSPRSWLALALTGFANPLLIGYGFGE